MRTPVFELHIRPLFRMTDHEHMRVQVDLWDYDQVTNNAERILGHLKAEDDRPLMPPLGSGGPWPEEWVRLYFEPPDAAVAGGAQPFSLEELYEGPETQSIDVQDSTGVHHVR